MFCKELLSYEGYIQGFSDNIWNYFEPKLKAIQVQAEVMQLLVKDGIVTKLTDRLNSFERQTQSDYGFVNKQKIANKIKELKKCIQIVQST